VPRFLRAGVELRVNDYEISKESSGEACTYIISIGSYNYPGVRAAFARRY
jgi:hypothetical protein